MDAFAGFDFSDPSVRADPYPAYRTLRENAPIWQAPSGQWMVSTFAGCAAFLRDPLMGRVDPRLAGSAAADEPAVAEQSRMMLFTDPPVHTRLRGLVTKAFSARRMEALRPRIAAVVDQLIDRVAARGGMCVIRDFAHRLPVTVICDLLGVPESEREPFLAESTVDGRLLDPDAASRADMDAANAASAVTDGYFRSLVARRRTNPGDDLVSALVQARDSDVRLSDDEIVANIALLFGAGHETTTNLIGNGLLALHRNPGQLARLRAEPALLPNAIEELLRYDSPVQLTSRFAIQASALMGEEIAEGDEVIALLGAANHDSAACAGDPGVLDIARAGVRPISFGGGIHFCLGAQLARIEGEIAFRRLLDRLPDMRLPETDAVRWKPTVTLRGLVELPAEW